MRVFTPSSVQTHNNRPYPTLQKKTKTLHPHYMLLSSLVSVCALTSQRTTLSESYSVTRTSLLISASGLAAVCTQTPRSQGPLVHVPVKVSHTPRLATRV